MTGNKIKLNNISKNRVSKKDRERSFSSKAEELISEKIENKKEPIVEDIAIKKDDKITQLLKKLEDKDKFIVEGMRQQSSINTSDYTNCLIDILIQAKLNEGEKIRKTSYLEKYLVKGLKEELKQLGIEI